MTIWGKLAAAMPWADKNELTECMYGKHQGALENCPIMVPPGEGWRQSGAVFCSAEHAALDQEDALF